MFYLICTIDFAKSARTKDYGEQLSTKFRLSAVTFATAAMVASLSGCGTSVSTTYNGLKVQGLEEIIDTVDAHWAQHRAEGTKSNIDEESRCYAQTSEMIMTDELICGPIHYLGDDDQVWETYQLDFVASEDEVQPVALIGAFEEGTRAENTDLYRPDGKESPDGLVIPEPDTATAPEEQALWDENTTWDEGIEGSLIILPDGGGIRVSDWAVSDRIGDSGDRLQAGDGRTFASISITDIVTDYNYEGNDGTYYFGADTETVPPDAEIDFMSNGKSFPLGVVREGTVSMSIPGDGKDAVLAVTSGGLTQTVSLSSGEIKSEASAYYDGLELLDSNTSRGGLTAVLEAEAGMNAEVRATPLEAFRDAYEPQEGWAPEGSAWVIVDTGWDGSITWRQGIFSAFYDFSADVTSAKIESLSGEVFTADAKRIDNISDDSLYGEHTTRLVFEVPAGVGDFKISMAVGISGQDTASTFDWAPPVASRAFDLYYEPLFARK